MKSLTNTLMVVAAAVAAVAGTASAQTLRAEVPFSFKAAGTVMPPGSYRISGSRSSGVPIFQILNTDVSKGVVVLPQAESDDLHPATQAKLVFRCAGGDCALAQIWTGASSGTYALRLPKSERQDVAMIAIAAKAD